ncbi:MAG: PAS domain S-box protein, partial [Planctomycetaceae bacterium]|nr:PAS domain S-box protein [Planctomycetaceae bacterium]
SLLASIQKSAEDLSPWNHEFQVRDSSGKERWLFANSVPERESDGSTLWHGYLADISERKHAEQALRRSRSDLTEAQRLAHIGSWYLDIASGEVTWSDELYRMYGFSPDFPPPPYDQHSKLFTPEAWMRLSTALTSSRDTGLPYELELEMVRQDGGRGWIWVRGEAVLNVAGATIGMRGVAQDITERKRAEAALCESETRLRIVTGCVRVGLVAADREHRYTFSNDAYCAILGLENRSIVGQRIADVLPDVYEARVRPKLDHAFTGERVEYEFQRQTSCGTVHCVVNYEPVMEGDSVSSVVAVVMDVTAQRSIEEQLRQSQKMETIGQLAGGVAHDFNNLLTIISGNTDLLLMTCADSPQVVGVLHEIQSAGRRAAELTQKLLAFSRQQFRSPESLDINSIIVETQTLLQRSVGKRVAISYSLGEKLSHVWMDRSELTQVLLNLAINARDAMGNEGQLKIETQRVEFFHSDAIGNVEIEPGAYNLLIVSDSGCGITEHVQARIFEPFFTTKPVGMGTGLGLSTVHGIVTGSGGAIHVTSVVGAGTTFRIYLPDIAKPEHPSNAFTKSQLPQGGSETLLLVDDDDSVRRLSRIILTDHGYEVIEASDGFEALRIFREVPHRFQLLVTDVKMPEMSGTSLAKEIRTLQPGIRVLFTSGFIDETETRNGLFDRHFSFLQKPFTPRELAEKVRSILDAAQ